MKRTHTHAHTHTLIAFKETVVLLCMNEYDTRTRLLKCTTLALREKLRCVRYILNQASPIHARKTHVFNSACPEVIRLSFTPIILLFFFGFFTVIPHLDDHRYIQAATQTISNITRSFTMAALIEK